ncbi:MAG: hypothetical protein F6K26_35015 [Moorea sp. SIO2I5]|nr:hypothetical protein [Moorena sp. SIO2I5]
MLFINSHFKITNDSVFHTYQLHSFLSRFPIPDSRFPVPCSLFPVP